MRRVGVPLISHGDEVGLFFLDLRDAFHIQPLAAELSSVTDVPLPSHGCREDLPRSDGAALVRLCFPSCQSYCVLRPNTAA